MNNKQQWYEVEKYVLSCMFYDDSCLEHGLDKLAPEMFSKAEHREIYRALDVLAGKVSSPTIDDLRAHFVGRGDILEVIDDIDWSSPSSTANFQSSCERLAGRWERREAYRLLQEAQRKIIDEAADPVSVLSDLMDRLATTTKQGADDYMDLHELMRVALEDAERRLQAQTPPYLDIGLPSLSPVIGLERGHLMIVAGASGEGKTTLALNMALHMAMHGHRVLYQNGEMPREQIARRVAAMLADVSNRALRQGYQHPDAARHVERLRQRASEVIANQDLRDRLYVSGALEMTIGRIISDIRRFARRHQIDVAIVDYIQRIPTAFDERAHQTLIQAAEQLKSLAVELGVAIVVLAQLNHDSDASRRDLAMARGMKRPADCVLNLVRIEDAGHVVDDEAMLEKLQNAGTTHIVYTSKLRDDVDNLWVPLRFYSQSRRMEEVALSFYDVFGDDQLVV